MSLKKLFNRVFASKLMKDVCRLLKVGELSVDKRALESKKAATRENPFHFSSLLVSSTITTTVTSGSFEGKYFSFQESISKVVWTSTSSTPRFAEIVNEESKRNSSYQLRFFCRVLIKIPIRWNTHTTVKEMWMNDKLKTFSSSSSYDWVLTFLPRSLFDLNFIWKREMLLPWWCRNSLSDFSLLGSLLFSGLFFSSPARWIELNWVK